MRLEWGDSSKAKTMEGMEGFYYGGETIVVYVNESLGSYIFTSPAT